jgi:hypothetical protein
MRKKKDPFTKPNGAYDTFVNQLYNQVNTNHVAWNILPATVAAILALLTPWNTLWPISKQKTTSTSTDRANTRLARKLLTAYLRPFVQASIYRNISMTDADIIACGLDPHDRVKSPVGKPTTEPAMDYKVSGTHLISAFYKQSPAEAGVSGRGKPVGVGLLKVALFISNGTPEKSDPAPASPDDFPKTITGRRSPVKILFNASDAGKKVTFAACWISTSNINGDWNEVLTMIVP